MRPQLLEISGFSCFKEPQKIDFAEVELFAIKGPTGAGKSSILDAITFALFGQTPRLGRLGLDALISQGATVMRVSLEFSAIDRYRVSRVFSGKASERQLRFERFDEASSRWLTACESTKIKDINEAIVQTIGLDFEGFTRAVLLPQGEFDRFLHGDPSERRDLLKGLLGLEKFDRMRELANQIARDLKTEIEKREYLREQTKTEISIEDLEQEIEKIQEELKNLPVKLSELSQKINQEQEILKMQGELSLIKNELIKLTGLEAEKERLNKAKQVLGILPWIETTKQAEKALDLAQKQKDLAQKTLFEVQNELAKQDQNQIENLQQQLNKLIEGINISPLYQKFKNDLNQLLNEQKNQQQTKIKLDQDLKNSENDLDNCKQAGFKAKESLEKKENELKQLIFNNSLANVTRDLKPGNPCPVCHSPLKDWQQAEENDLGQLEQEVNYLRSDLLAKRSEYAAITEKVKNLKAKVAELAEKSVELEQKIAQNKSQFDKLTKQLLDVLSDIYPNLAKDSVDSFINQLSEHRTKLEKQLSNLKNLSETIQKKLTITETEAKKSIEIYQERLIEAQNQQEKLQNSLQETGLADVEQALSQALPAEELKQLEQSLQISGQKLDEFKRRELEIIGKLAGRQGNALYLTDLQSEFSALNDRQQQNQHRHGQLTANLGEIKQKRELSLRLSKEIAEFSKRYDNYAALANDLRGNEFQDFLLSELQSELLARASKLMQDLSEDRYQLAWHDGEYRVLDAWNALESRSTKTLSGGESFIASLALALALSDYLAGAKRLEALFLDEGFGTLDAESLASVADALENLQTQGRMVGVITHVASLAERLPNRLVVEKSVNSSQTYWEE